MTEARVIPGTEPLDFSVCGSEGSAGAGFLVAASRSAAWDLICSIDVSDLRGGTVSFSLEDWTHPFAVSALGPVPPCTET